MDEIKSALELSQNNNLIASSGSSVSSDEWESDEETIGYQPLPQDPIENGEHSDSSCNDNDEVCCSSKAFTLLMKIC